MDQELWREYSVVLKKNKISQKAVEWYIKWGEFFDNSLSGVPLAERTEDDVRRYINSFARGKCKDW